MWIVEVLHHPEALVSHANARRNVHGRRLLVDPGPPPGLGGRARGEGVGISRQCPRRWVNRFDAEGEAGLSDRSSRPRSSPRRTTAAVEAAIMATRVEHRREQDWLGPELGVPARTVSRVLRRRDMPHLRCWTR